MKYKNVKLFLIGGEITILKEFILILQKIVYSKFDGNINIHIKTNLSCNKQILKKIIRLFHKKNRQITISASYYKEYTKEKEFIKKIKYLHYNSYFGKIVKKLHILRIFNYSNINVGIYYPLFIDKDYIDFLNFKKKYNRYADFIDYIIIRNYKTTISLELKEKLYRNSVIIDKKIKVTKKDGTIEYFSGMPKLSLAIEKTRQFNPYGMLCDSGIHNISIGNLGDISRCPSCKEKTIIGNILNDNFELLDEKVICPSYRCNCNYYRKIENIQNRKE